MATDPDTTKRLLDKLRSEGQTRLTAEEARLLQGAFLFSRSTEGGYVILEDEAHRSLGAADGDVPETAQIPEAEIRDEPRRTKLTVNIPEREMAALRKIAAQRDMTLTDVIRRAIAMEQFIEEVESQGGKLLVEQRDRSMRQLVLR